jgi:hypothetical protein
MTIDTILNRRPAPTTRQVNAALAVTIAISETIRELGEVPSGHLYAGLIGEISLQDYERIIGVLKNTWLVREDPSHLLTWTGPEVRK